MPTTPMVAGPMLEENSPLATAAEGSSSNGPDSSLGYISAILYGFLSIIVLELLLNGSGLRAWPISRLLFNVLVYVTPSPIASALGLTAADMSTVSDFQAKGAAIQRVFGFQGRSNDDVAHGTSSLPQSSPPDRPRSPRPSYSSFSSILSPARYLGNSLLGGGAGGRGGPTEHLPPGLGNWDNSCYQNSVIQALASLRSLTGFLDRNVESLATEGSSFTTHEALRDILGRLNDPSNNDRNLWTPAALKSMSSWQQQDAQEYFSKILEQIDREVLQASRWQTTNLGLKVAGPGEHIIGAVEASDLKIPTSQDMQAVERSSLRNPFEGFLAQRVGCMRCGYTEGLSLFQFNCITVPLVASRECTVRECLDQYMDLESIEGVECAKCTLLRAREQLRSLVQQVQGGECSTLKASAQSRLDAVEEAIDEEDFSDKTLTNKCRIPPKNRVSSTKSRQSVVARAPQCLAIHVNRSLFDEYTGMLRKNYAEVHFPMVLDLEGWSLGSSSSSNRSPGGQVPIEEEWDTDPQKSMISRDSDNATAGGSGSGNLYELRAVITHYGRHENGHYICYRKYASDAFPADVPEAVSEADGGDNRSARWFRLSDENVHMVSEQFVLSQGGVFMLLYEAVDDDAPSHGQHMDADKQSLLSAATTSINTADDMSITSMDGLTQDDSDESSTSRTLSVSPPAPDRIIPPIEQGTFSKLDTECDSAGSDKDGDDRVPSPDIVAAV